MKILAAHQPRFFPNLGYFKKFYKSDVFIHLRSLQFTPSEYFHRTKLICPNHRYLPEVKWLTLPVVSPSTPPTCINKTIVDASFFFNTLDSWLRVRPYGSFILQRLFKSFSRIFENADLSRVQLDHIALWSTRWCLDEIDHDYSPKIIQYAEIDSIESKKDPTDRLVDLCKYHQCDVYLSGSGGRKYLNLGKFEENNIKVIFNDYSEGIHPVRINKKYYYGVDTEGLSILESMVEGYDIKRLLNLR